MKVQTKKNQGNFSFYSADDLWTNYNLHALYSICQKRTKQLLKICKSFLI